MKRVVIIFAYYQGNVIATLFDLKKIATDQVLFLSIDGGGIKSCGKKAKYHYGNYNRTRTVRQN